MSQQQSGNAVSDIFVNINVIDAKDRFYDRVQKLRQFYKEQFGTEPNFYCRVPGRVNLIGEHVDYCGYPVLPMAVDQCIILAVGQTSNETLQLRNIEVNKFVNFSCDLKQIDAELTKSGGPKWYKYYLCGIKGIYESLDSNVQPRGMNIALSGNIPPASGLSSSSALVSSAALATAHVHELPLDRKNLASISARCECYIGTQSGGMDQAIAYLAKPGCAQFIEFHPKLNTTPIILPNNAYFVIANSLAESFKASSSNYNERVVECRLGTRWLAKYINLTDWRNIIRLVQLQDVLSCTLEELEALTNKYLTQDCYTREEVCKALEVTDQEFQVEFLTPNTQHMLLFHLRPRALHVIQESLRVLRFRDTCQNKNIADVDKISKLGELMRQSHHSLKELYDCSHDDLERLIAISKESSISARLTGAGWGGCIVALCDSIEASNNYIKLLKEKYFSHLPVHILERHQHNDFADVVFATIPCNGAEIIKIET